MAALPRRTGIVSVATLTAMSLAVVLAHAIAPDWSRAIGLDIWNDQNCDIYDSIAVRDELESMQKNLVDQIEASSSIVRKLRDGSMTLADAVAELEEINAGRQCFADALRLAYPEASTNSLRLAKYAIFKSQRLCGLNGLSSCKMIERLEAEYEAMEENLAR